MVDRRRTEKDPEKRNERRAERKPWQEPELKRRETLPRITNGFAGSFPP